MIAQLAAIITKNSHVNTRPRLVMILYLHMEKRWLNPKLSNVKISLQKGTSVFDVRSNSSEYSKYFEYSRALFTFTGKKVKPIYRSDLSCT